MTGETKLIFKIADARAWSEAEREGSFRGAPVDLADGYIHFSTAEQAAATAAKHFKGASGLVLAAVDVEALGGDLRWEPARGGELFPHLYAPLPLSAVRWTRPIPAGPDGEPTLEGLLP